MIQIDSAMSKDEEYKEKIIGVYRNTKVVKGGRIFSFSSLVVIGNENGKIGIGRGKAKEVAIAIQKGLNKAHRNIVHIQLKDGTLFHKVESYFCATKVILMPALNGTGIIAGGTMRAMFEVIGIKNIFGKCIGSTNAYNVVLATLKGLIRIKPSYRVDLE